MHSHGWSPWLAKRISHPRPPAAGLSAVADRTNPRFFTQILAEKTRRLVRRGGFFGFQIVITLPTVGLLKSLVLYTPL